MFGQGATTSQVRGTVGGKEAGCPGVRQPSCGGEVGRASMSSWREER